YLLDDSASALLTESSPGFATRPTRQGAYQDGYFFGYGRNYRTALADLRELAGPAPLLPKKALGVWFSRYWPYSDAEWRELVALFRMKNVPLDVLSLDTDWKSSPEMNVCASINAITGAPPDAPCSWNGWDWNTMLYPDPNGFMDWAHAQGLQIGLNIHPSINGGDPAYAQVVAIAGELEPDPTPLPCDILQADLSNPCLVFDWTNPAHIEAYFGLHAPIASAGVDFWWLDWCCEGSSAVAPGLTPDTWINSLYLEEHRRLGSRWPSFSRIGGSFQVGADARDEGQGAFAEHRMSIHFTGDTCSTWELLRYVAEFTVVEGASIGLPYISHDIGSFHGFRPGATTCTAVALTPTLPDDMYVRWVQFGTFQPLDRLHSQHGERLPWDYPGEAETIATAFLRLRGRLVPHLYTLSREAYDTGLPMARALYLQWPEHDEAYADPSSFTLGDDLLVATVASPGQEAEVDVWLPPGTWVDYFTGERLEGPGMVQRTVPLDRYPVFARLGTILPTQPDLPTSADGPQDNLTLNIWPGADGAYTLYEDEGIGFAFEAGAYQRTHIALSSPDPDCSTVTVQASEGAPFPGALAERSWTLRFVGLDSPTQVTLDGLPVASAAGEPPVWTYDASTQTLTMETGLVSTEQDLHVQVGSRCP
ncbi:MAG: TIM-barrel domain-containing protein, partial [Myxococcota bacterium]